MNKENLAAYYGLADDVCNAYMKRYNVPKYLREDMHATCLEALLLANKDYKEDKGTQFHTYASYRMRTSMSNMRKKEATTCTPLIYIEDVDPFHNTETEEVVDYDWNLVDKWEPEDAIDASIYNEILMGDSTYQEIADAVGSNKLTIRSRKKRLVKKLRAAMGADSEVQQKLN